MITKVEFRVDGESTAYTMDVLIPKSTTKYLIRDIRGLTPVKSDIITTKNTLLDGEGFNSSQKGKRNIVIDFEYRPDWSSGESATTLRNNLYKFASPGTKVEVFFTIDNSLIRRITGYIESLDSPLFSSDVTGQLSIICPVPEFLSEMKTVNLTSAIQQRYDYSGSSPTGVVVHATPHTTLGTYRINIISYALPAGSRTQTVRVVTTSSDSMPVNDQIRFSSKDREKYFSTVSGRNLIPLMTLFGWPKIYPGRNEITIQAFSLATGNELNNMDVQMYFDERFGGL